MAEFPDYPDQVPQSLGHGAGYRSPQMPVVSQGAPAPQQTPFYIAGYRLLKALGSGTMGEVWKVADSRGNLYAAKILRSKLAVKPGIAQRFRMEKDLVTGVRHQNIVEVYDLVQTPEYMAIIMEYTDGGDLGELLKKRGTLLPLDAVYYCMGIAAGLSPIHHAGIVHRDLKPSNILLKRQGNYLVPKIADFGLARWIDPRYEIQTTKRSGTPYYMAPEMIEGKGVSSKTDIYSLGVILYELLCGITPFRGSVGEVLEHQFYDMPGMLPGIPGSLWNVITQMLAKETSVRPSAAQTHALLKSVVDQVRPLDALPVLKEPPPPQPLEDVVKVSPADAKTSLASAKPIIPAHDEAETQSGQTARGQVEPAAPVWRPVALPPAIMVNTEEAIGVGGSPGGFSPPGEQEESANEQTLGAWENSPGFAESPSSASPRQDAPARRRGAAKEIVGGVAIGLGVGALITLVAAVILLLL
ncbi:serine/threonine-protein kinase [Varibaculum prostatecancerukia]|uniref:serine/threonine-protein kinase n=1 Tax=Varibaculum prostatecancerukia TaxID=2811781 RepID=UPI001C0027B9|nr:serine/threonine-protein kinase [Varibaculum prostatecancerukia]